MMPPRTISTSLLSLYCPSHPRLQAIMTSHLEGVSVTNGDLASSAALPFHGLRLASTGLDEHEDVSSPVCRAAPPLTPRALQAWQTDCTCVLACSAQCLTVCAWVVATLWPLWLRFNLRVQARCKAAVDALGGSFDDVLRDGTTHLVALDVCSTKYAVAAEAGIAIVKPSWVHACAAATVLVDVDAHRLAPFTGCSITVTGFTASDGECTAGARNVCRAMTTRGHNE